MKATPLRRILLFVVLSTAACTGKLGDAYGVFKPYEAPSPVRMTHQYGLPKEPLSPEGPGKIALPSTRPDQDAQCVVSLSISGGGSNSAAFAWGALEELNERHAGPGGRSVLEEIDYMVTASGGGIAALLLMEVLREHRLREHGPLTQAEADAYFESARFRGVLDAQLSTVDQVVKSGFASTFFGDAASGVQDRLRTAMVGEGAPCHGAEAGPLAAVPKETDAEFERYVLCPLTEPLRFEDVLVDASKQATLPAFLPTVTLFESGENVPATRAWFEQLGLQDVMFALPNSWSGEVVPVEKLDYVHAVTLSMSFPGIGPVLAIAKQGDQRYGVTIADGGQTDNLGLWTAYNATRNELLSQSRRGAVHIVLDSAIEPETPFVEEKVDNWKAVTASRVIGNGLPLLRAARHTDRRNLELRARDELKEKADTYQAFFVRAGTVLDTQEMLYQPFVELGDRKSCYRADLPTDRATCLANAKPCKSRCSPRERLGGIISSLANDRQRAEDLVALGHEAMARVYENGLKDALNRCLAQAPGAQPAAAPPSSSEGP